ncbi:uncharacterized protein BO95DRAFT_462467 [Aspergillus brunneoviolaceus CBS 621.78]|uniref:Uncharacterized protein n=1 Tax=Aspergillus brunneoviolaceus CBS 621.78 TaxID=1450534 RepID=A0ACD1GD03_9EURO|nr:hypothetical protein BO95DRAFT_462467 [Aspergillus brunneoviolaceus CBS 621.78]RAH47136.1 hypothetical protein BO95DRAFT_462467 [Aspergillus brunneoviolaceus CBS 621.78]
MKAFRAILFTLALLGNLCQGSPFAVPSEAILMYCALVLDFSANGASRTLAPKLSNTALVDFGTFISTVFAQRLPQSGIWTSMNPQYNQATLDEIGASLKTDKYSLVELLGLQEGAQINHRSTLQRIADIVKSTRGSTALGFADVWNNQYPEFRRALAGTQAVRVQDMYRTSVSILWAADFPDKTLKASEVAVLDTDVTFLQPDWSATAAANGESPEEIKTYRTWYVGLSGRSGQEARKFRNHQKITNTIGQSLSELDSVDSCKAR